MKTTQPKIRPRMRDMGIVAQPHGNPEPSTRPAGRAAADGQDMPPLPMLARLPEVTQPTDPSKLTVGLDWLKRLDWQQVRRIKFDPNWVAGGVLSLVLLLLLVITFNRSGKEPVEPDSTRDAPTWTTAGKNAPTTGSPVSTAGDVAPGGAAGIASGAAAEAKMASTGADTTPANSIAPADQASHLAVQSPNQYAAATSPSLDGIYYPVTPYPAIAAQPVVGSAPAGAPPYDSGIRTAQRDVTAAPQASGYVGAPPASQARFEGGIITRP
jgi:hypothetical protein